LAVLSKPEMLSGENAAQSRFAVLKKLVKDVQLRANF